MCNWGDKIHRKFVIYMSKYLFHVLIGLDAAFPLHLSWLQLEAAEMTFHVHILDTRCSWALSNSNRQEGGKGNSVLPLPCTFYLTPNLFLNEPVTVVHRALCMGCHWLVLVEAVRHHLICSDIALQAWWETSKLNRRTMDFLWNRMGQRHMLRNHIILSASCIHGASGHQAQTI